MFERVFPFHAGPVGEIDQLRGRGAQLVRPWEFRSCRPRSRQVDSVAARGEEPTVGTMETSPDIGTFRAIRVLDRLRF